MPKKSPVSRPGDRGKGGGAGSRKVVTQAKSQEVVLYDRQGNVAKRVPRDKILKWDKVKGTATIQGVGKVPNEKIETFRIRQKGVPKKKK